MLLICIIATVSVVLLVWTTIGKGFEQALPVAAFLLLLFPNECQIRLPGLFELTTQRILVIVLLLLYAVFGKSNKNDLPLKYLVALQVGWMFVSTFESVVFTVSLKTVLSQVLDYVVPFYIFARSITKVRTIEKIFVGIVSAITLCCVFGAFEAYGYPNIITIFPPIAHRFGSYDFAGERGARVMATFGHPILFGAAISMAVPIALYLLTRAKNSRDKVLLWGGVMLMFLNVYKTGSRGAWIATVMSVAMMLLFGMRKLRKYGIIIVTLSALVLIVRPGVWDTVQNNYVATMDPNSPQGESYDWRYALYRIARRELARDFGRSLWGYGPESFYYLHLQGEFHGHMAPFESCDSSIAAIMIETGYVGLLTTSLLFLKGISRAFRAFRTLPRPVNNLSLVLLANLIAFCFMMSNVALFGWGQQNYILWIVLPLTVIYPKLVRAELNNNNNNVEAKPALSSNPVVEFAER
jgi:O-Antigen ligase